MIVTIKVRCNQYLLVRKFIVATYSQKLVTCLIISWLCSDYEKYLTKINPMNKLLTVLCFAILNTFRECLCYISKCSVLTCCLLTGVHVAEIQQWYNLSFAHFSGMFSHDFANVYDFRNVLAIFAASSGASQSYIQMRSSDERTGGNFENSHIQGSRAFAYLFAQFPRMFATFRNVRY